MQGCPAPPKPTFVKISRKYKSIPQFLKNAALHIEPDYKQDHICGRTVNMYELKDVPGKGKGLVAIITIPRGTRMLSEEAAIRIPYNNPFDEEGIWDASLARAYKDAFDIGTETGFCEKSIRYKTFD